MAPSILAGTIALAALVASAAAIGWWLFFSPIRESVPVVVRDERHDAALRRVATLAILVYAVLGSGGAWDVSWHMRLGIAGTAQDFWWPPHILMYGCFGALSLIGFIALARVLGSGGGVRARFRAQPLLGAFSLISLYQMASGPVDEIWHKVYGTDTTAWAFPHLVIVGLSAVALAILVSVYLSAIPRRSAPRELLLGLPFAVILWNLMAVAVGDWEFTLYVGAVPAGNPLLDRPAWQYIVAGTLPGAVVLGAASGVIGGRWVLVRVIATMMAWSASLFALFAVLGAPTPLWTTPVSYLVGAAAADLWRMRHTGRGGAPVGGLIFAVTQVAVSTSLTVAVTRIVDLTQADLLLAAPAAVILGTAAYALGHAAGSGLDTLPERVAPPAGARPVVALAAR